jgi:hypothetical protein
MKILKADIAIGIVGFFLIFAPVVLYEHFFKKKHHLVTIEDEIRGTAIQVYRARGSSYVKLDDGSFVWFIKASNYQYEIPHLNEVLRTGDQIIKKCNSDTIVILKRTGGEYFFVSGESIGLKN